MWKYRELHREIDGLGWVNLHFAVTPEGHLGSFSVWKFNGPQIRIGDLTNAQCENIVAMLKTHIKEKGENI